MYLALHIYIHLKSLKTRYGYLHDFTLLWQCDCLQVETQQEVFSFGGSTYKEYII